MRGTFDKYVGTDVDEEAISWARENVEPILKGCRFFFPDEIDWGQESGQYNLVLSHEVIEHIDSKVEEYLGSLRSLVSLRGKVFISTPNGRLSRGNPDLFQSRSHVREYSPSEFGLLLERIGFQPTLFAQGRRDLVDSLPWVILRRAGKSRESVGRTSEKSTGHSSYRANRVLRAAWNSLPSTEVFWRIVPLVSDSAFSDLASHMIARCQTRVS
jgi:hypothetical protein